MSNINIPTQVSPFPSFAQFPTVGKTRVIYIDQATSQAYYWSSGSSTYVLLGGAVAVNWGSITGTLSTQTDLQNALNTKVDKVTGKGLSTNDYTTAEKNKLSGIQAGAEVNVNADWNATTGDAVILNKPTIPSTGDLVPYTGATASVDLGENDLSVRKVFLYDEVNNNFGSIHYTDGNFHIEDADGHKLFVVEDGFLQLHLTDTIQSNLWTTMLTVARDHYLPDASGTLALLSDVSLKENSANKATTMTGNTGSNILFLTAKALYDWATALFQPLLVSGTNIKTLNGASLLGSGGLSVQPTLVSGTNIKTINGTSILGSGDLVVGGGGGALKYSSLQLTNGASVTNSTTETITYSVLVPANTFTTNAFFDFNTRITKTGSLSGWSARVYKNTSNSLTGATLIATLGNPFTASNTYTQSARLFRVESSVIRYYQANFAGITDNISNSVNEGSTTFNLAVDNYFLITIQLGAISVDTVRGVFCKILGYE